MGITIDRSYRAAGLAPLYRRYDGQTRPQDGILELAEEGRVRVGYDPEIGNAVPMTVWHQRTLRWILPATLNPQGIDRLLDRLAPLLERIHAGHSVRWDGSNMTGMLTADADAAAEEITDGLMREEWIRPDEDVAQVWDADDWLHPAVAVDHERSRIAIGPDILITRRTGERRLRQLARRLEREAEVDSIVLDGDLYDILRSYQAQL